MFHAPLNITHCTWADSPASSNVSLSPSLSLYVRLCLCLYVRVRLVCQPRTMATFCTVACVFRWKTRQLWQLWLYRIFYSYYIWSANSRPNSVFVFGRIVVQKIHRMRISHHAAAARLLLHKAWKANFPVARHSKQQTVTVCMGETGPQVSKTH